MAMVSRARASLPSPSSSPLPAFSPRSPQSEVVERMFTRGGSGRSSSSSASGANRSASLREIDEEAAILHDADDDDGGGKLYVAVGKDIKDSRSNLVWAARNLFAGDPKLVLLHVHQPADRIMIGLCKVPASQVEEKELKAYRKIEKEEMNTLLNQYLNFCRVSLKMQAETLVIEKNSPANGIIELIDQNRITKLVMGTSSFSVKRKVPKSKVAASVHLQAKPYCQIFYICKEALGCSREATELCAKVESPRSSFASTISDQPELTPRSLSLPPGHPGLLGATGQQPFPRRSNSVSYPLSGLIADSVENMSAARRQSIDSLLGSTDQQALPRRSNSVSYSLSGSIAGSVEIMSPARRQSIDMTPTGSSPSSSQQSTGGSSLGLRDLDSMDGSPVPASVASSEEHQHSTVEIHEMFEQLHRVRNQLERSKKEASEGRQKAERDLFESSMMFKARESSLRKEKKEVEERLTKEKADLEKEHFHVCNELQKANEQRAELESKLLQTNALMEELQQLQVELQREKDHAVKEAEEMRQTNGNSVFGSTSAVALTEFSYTEIEEATDNFDDSKKIGSGGCGTVYKGFLRHTTVAIKKFNREGTTGDKEFNDEVETLSRMRHPNLVTLIGVCREAKALVFEFLSNGSLENCLQGEHQREPLSWRMRIRIAADICTGLIFLHSNKPKGIAHGDLKPDNVLLDNSFVCKLADFGISRPLDLTNTTVTPYHRTNQIKGTMGYMDPGYIASGEITAQYDVYSFGVVLMRLLTGKSPLGLPNEVEAALSNDMLQDIIDTSAGEWPTEYTEELARLALRCCRYERKERPNLANEAWGILQAMMNCPDDKCKPPTFFICPMTQEIMRDPHIAADGFTYEGEAIKDWLQRGHKCPP
ncbi:U-box domain-containing protein 33 isoform X1 [Aegilops tauschii subsp. strangulata]|uniref:RING-type E3 ubiquitin transferase n=4 Tax=Aegilops tauschii TaxID=37682 RepID=A0A453L9Y7_AEGTS|nr:U-box domain-containing protein 33 [Aegilops tauschii subsp. strangulata]